ncbi:PDZ domain-containing protein 4-like isoform X2 [Acipenser ruthenus]|uniref:PDZ domain-containing protein 4-like isoform X2 n=1 Tax=Acipenser ruthenus TaxID=7906 RepID=UPI002741BE60|nr:PDZ domain-containing protein 4-like isoform X2 [Acipenser ruthenus]
MGCNMCVMQKPEDQCKVMFQVNGKEVSRLSQQQTLEVLRSSRDPLVIQVMRRSPRSKGGGARGGGGALQDFIDNGTQTDITFEHIMALSKLRPPSPPLPPEIEPYSLAELAPLDHEYYDPTDYLDGSRHEVDRTDELEYEEVELYKSSQQDKLGLTVCYRTDEEEDLGIYIGEVNPNSIAAKDGRIREGDRILQINGVDVQNREEAVAILTREDSTNFSLLLARPDIETDKQNDNSRELKELDRHLSTSCPLLDNVSPLNETRGGAVDSLRTVLSNSQELDSGVGRTDESTRYEESSEHDLLGDEQTSNTTTPGSQRKFHFGAGGGGGGGGRSETSSLHSRDFHFSTDSLLPLDCGPALGYAGEPSLSLMMPGLTEEEFERYRELLEIKCHLENGNHQPLPNPYPYPYPRRAETGGGLSKKLDVNRNESMEHEMAMLEEELRHLEFKCRNILRAQKMQQLRERCMKAWLLEEEASKAAMGLGLSEPLAHELSDITELPERSDKDTTSAYNTGESCRTTPLATDLPSLPGSPLRGKGTNLNRAKPSREGSPAKFGSLSRDRESRGGKRHSESRRNPKSSSSREQNTSTSPYFSSRRGAGGRLPEHYRSCVQLGHPGGGRGEEEEEEDRFTESSGGHQSPMSLASMCQDSLVGVQKAAPRSPRPPPEPVRMEWKVKVRSDGTRFVAKRPVRDRLLKARAMKIKEERSGMTTDDDAVSEMKMGRYWSKEERKQHLVRAREQRKRREFMIQSRLDCLREQHSLQPGGEGGEGGRAEMSIIALSHRKTMKKRNRRILDNWITIQEMLAHGSRSADGKKIYNPLLSVTTV